MGKQRHLRKHTLSLFLPLLVGTTTISCAALSVAVFNKYETSLREIPESFYNLSPDGKILYGFKENIRQTDIYDYGIVKIPDSVETIKAFAFIYAFDEVGTNITKLVLNDNLKTIENGAFAYCDAFQYVNHFVLGDRDNSHLESIGDEAFSNCKLRGDLYFPNSLKHIGSRAFNNCNKLNGTIYFPRTIETIDSYAFDNCQSVSHIDLTEYDSIPQWLKTPNYIFNKLGIQGGEPRKSILLYIHEERQPEWLDCIQNRQSLPSESYFTLEIMNKLPQDVFKLNDKKDELQGFVDSFDITTLNQYAEMTIPITVKTINASAFKDKITNCQITINLGQVEKIKDSAFEGCTGLVGSIAPDALKEIGKRAFYGCSNIDTVNFSTEIEILSDEMFKNCTNLQYVTLHDFIDDDNEEEKEQKLGEGAFANCVNLRQIDVTQFSDLPTSWSKETWNETPFANVTSFGEVIVNGQLSIDSWKNLLISCGLDGLGSQQGYEDSYNWSIIQQKTFIGCPETYLTTTQSRHVLMGLSNKGMEDKTLFNFVSIPFYITSIYHDAFNGVFPFTEVGEKEYIYWRINFNYGLREINDYAFKNDDGIDGSLSLPKDLQYLGNQAFYNCKHLRGLFTLPDSLTHIGNQCFHNCRLLRNDSLIMPSQLEYLGDDPFGGMYIANITFNSSPSHWGHFIFDQVFGLQKINIKNINYDSLCNATHYPDSLWNASVGTIIVNQSASQEQWETLLKTNMGLPSSWTIQRE